MSRGSLEGVVDLERNLTAAQVLAGTCRSTARPRASPLDLTKAEGTMEEAVLEGPVVPDVLALVGEDQPVLVGDVGGFLPAEVDKGRLVPSHLRS